MENPQYDRIIDRLYAKAGTLHGECFYRGQCEPKSSYEEKIRETESFIEDIRKLIGA